MKNLKLIGTIMILFLGIMLFSNLAHAADTTKITKEVIYNDAKDLIKASDTRITNALGSLGKTLKVGADQVWHVLVRQQKVWSICFLILTLSAIFNWYLFYSRNFKKLSKSDCEVLQEDIIGDIDNPQFDVEYHNRYKYYENNPSYKSEISNIRYKQTIKGVMGKKDILVPLPTNSNISWFKYLHLTICLVLSVFSFIHFSDMLTGFINPEYGAMKTIATIAQNLK